MSALPRVVRPEQEDPDRRPEPGWKRARVTPTLAEVYKTVPIDRRSLWRKILAFAGPGYLVAVGYMDPGNWATDLAGGSRFGYTLLSVILLSNLMAVLLQGLALKLGIVTGRDLAQACRDHFSTPVNIVLWVLCEIAIAACDLAEVIGSAIALNLLFGMPLAVGVIVTALDVLVVLFLQHKGFRLLEALVVTLIATVGICFLFEMFISRPDFRAVLGGFVPSGQIVRDREMLYIAIGILGATVMPHNLYLHSSIVQTRRYESSAEGKREAVRFAFLDSTIALSFALFINAAILIVAAATFHTTGNTQVAEIQDAHKLLTPLLGVAGASTVFALALLASGQNSTLTGTLAGQIVMEGFLSIRLRPWLRRLITRAIAVVPAVIVAVLYGESGTAKLLILSQVILSLQLSFAVFPLVMFTSDRAKMGDFVNSRAVKALAYVVAVFIAVLNAWLLVKTFSDWMA
ncbi:MAG: Nramp family divalent metal transporter [Gemmatimonadaceae bacterium]|nr:Nramp family divalent metal transporter [Gemmatimonadaceae bacterium]NUQ94206.1 Nramp family divalent metal transporter [Gemmatimonadaceae bacterium]NUR21049.1 Nramp family divalent metal transporter [Gemmatimonadaceae bacterium]NUS97925.1 Nramp family divalent metal transporter [Gemmatimonadaceae bacterium]